MYSHPSRELWALAHVDDFLICGGPKDAQWCVAGIEEQYLCKAETLGVGPGEVSEIVLARME